ncbi:pre-mRNA 3'-end-processing factor FIP1 isoform X2 [Hyalella azteca]|uniref:Pre-mRNA 3'-end-processing factor FIP1 isoform X2 n=1 Tax=Hyalella azteca TaxID=294128 RepID=A0A8B7PBR3_HYAAZ|nr:pre-mRNA 3'-end-processing factor FIP1 isoform X2 [Hyalella azteca]
MTEVQDDDHWLYGEDNAEKEAASQQATSKEDNVPEGSDSDGKDAPADNSEQTQDQEKPDADAGASLEPNDKEALPSAGDAPAADATIGEGGKEGEDDAAGESSDEDDLTITIGELKKAAEVMTPGQHQARFQPKAAPTTGLKDDDFATAGKVNGVAVADLNLADYEDKPWRKPGADLSDYFNYGFNEQSWFKYCDRQKRMRMHESGSGLNSLGINVGKPFGYLSNSENKSNGAENNGNSTSRPPRASVPFNKRVDNPARPEGNSIQVMTADRREYSNKVMPPSYMSGPPPPMPHGPYDDMEFGGNMWEQGPDNGYYPPVSYYGTPPPAGPPAGPPVVQGPPPNFNAPPVSWNNPPPPMVPPPQMVPPAAHVAPPPPRWGGEVPPPPSLTGGISVGHGESPPQYRTDRDRDDSDDDRKRSRRHRRLSRSPSRPRHRTRSRSRSPSHKHKRKKSKRDRDAD